jgi:hypothetical protein
MYHTIQFFVDIVADVEVSPQRPLERVLIRKGTRLRVELKPHVAETIHGPVEVADLYFEDGTCTRAVPYAFLTFVD